MKASAGPAQNNTGKEPRMNVVVIDAQGGGIGKQLIIEIRKKIPDLHITAVGTNASASAAMLKAGADQAACGENAAIVCARRADVIIGPVGIVIADAMLGEITPKIAQAVGASDAKRILIPFRNCDTVIAGVSDLSVSQLIQEAVKELNTMIKAD